MIVPCPRLKRHPSGRPRAFPPILLARLTQFRIQPTLIDLDYKYPEVPGRWGTSRTFFVVPETTTPLVMF